MSRDRRQQAAVMKTHLWILVVGISINLAGSQPIYRDYFTDNGLRIDYYQVGDRHHLKFILDELFQEDSWAGNPGSLLDTMNLGHFLVNIYDVKTNLQIYSSGFSTLFEEWQTTDEALAGESKVIGGTLRIPFPRHKIQVEILCRDEKNLFTIVARSWIIDPPSPAIRREKRSVNSTLLVLEENGPPATRVDLLIMGDGYTSQEADKFHQDSRRVVEKLFTIEPFRSSREQFNVIALHHPSSESGIDDPRQGVFRNTSFNFSFNTFGSQRYVMSLDNKSLNDIASAVPFDVVLVILNTDIYGGGGVYNLYACASADNQWSDNIITHELGHGFAGLGDEYYTSDIAYHDFYPDSVEPWEPNLTLLNRPGQVKWNQFVTPGLPIPTPWQQEKYDNENSRYAREKAEIEQRGETHQKINKLSAAHRETIQNFFKTHPYRGQVGAFQGAGYKSRGIYRPSLECLMFSTRTLEFDPVCTEAIQKRIMFYTHQNSP